MKTNPGTRASNGPADKANNAETRFAFRHSAALRRAGLIPWIGSATIVVVAALTVLYVTCAPMALQWMAAQFPERASTHVLGPLKSAIAASPLENRGTEQAPEVAGASKGPTSLRSGVGTQAVDSTAGLLAQVVASATAPRPVLPTATPEPENETLTLRPAGGDVGWWVSGDTPQAFIGDSFLYSGFGDSETYISAVRFDLVRVDRGAPVMDARLRLTGLRDDLLNRDASTTWLVQLIAEEVLPTLGGQTFADVYGAPASITLSPELSATEVGVGTVNEWVLDANARDWLFQQMVDGATSVTARIAPFNIDGDSLFAWDSGNASESEGNDPELILELGPAPPIPPPTATRPFVVATLTPLPENVLTVVAQAAEATITAQALGTGTPESVAIVTPTPEPQNLATVQAAAIRNELPPVVLNTPAPLNGATATANAAYATAVALTTGTFTPVPTNYVTPAIFYPPPPPENVATAAARVLIATAQAQSGTPTATRPWNAVPAIYVFATETPSNQETAVAQIVERNQAAIADGTATPTPWNLVVITSVPEPTATPIPLIVAAEDVTATPSPTPQREVDAQTLGEFSGKILFLSDRGGSEQTWVMDPSTGEVLALVTDDRVHELAQEQLLAYSPDGNRRAYVAEDGELSLQIFVEDRQYNLRQQVTYMADCCGGETTSYDPTWSPTDDKIAFVSTASGGDEIYVLDLSIQDPVRLTFNTWEWDKHPTWSPDGTKIAFFSNRESGRTQIWVMDADGNNQRNLSNSPYNDWDPIWVP